MLHILAGTDRQTDTHTHTHTDQVYTLAAHARRGWSPASACPQ